MKPKKGRYQPKGGDFVFVKWLDAFSVDDWTPNDECSEIKPCEIKSVGIVVENCSSHLTLALNFDTVNSNFSCILTIPRGMITAIRQL